MKNYIRKTVKPTSIDELYDGISYFWDNFVTIEYCNSKIDHLSKVIKQVLLLNGKATGL